jgi:hypothetical protein
MRSGAFGMVSGPSDLTKDIEDAYGLSPMQQGMLYDTIGSARSGMYCIVICYRLNGAIDSRAFADAWQAVAARHPILRTSFSWHDGGEPLQLVHRDAHIPVVEHDWRASMPQERHHRVEALLQTENLRGFDLVTPPLMRVTLIRCADEVYELVLAHHHLLLDGSCRPLLFREVFAHYEAACGREPGPLDQPRPYRGFIEWLRDQDLPAAERFWRSELGGFSEPTPLWSRPPVDTAAARDYEEHRMALDDEASDRLRQFARTRRLTLNTLVCGAWALLLGHSSGRGDVVFGATVNARPPALDGAEAMLGLFINTLPVRIAISPATPLVEWLRSAQRRQMIAREPDFAPLSHIQRWSDVPRGIPLFESIIVFENNAGYGGESERHGAIDITNARARIRNSLPLTLRCVPERRLALQLLYDTRRFPAGAIEAIGRDLVRLLDEMTRSGDLAVAHLMTSLDDAQRGRAVDEAQAFRQAVGEKLRRQTRGRRGSRNEES